MARRVLGVVAVTATAALTTLALTGTAQAHNPIWSAGCDEGAKTTKVSIDLEKYVASKKGKNTVTLTDGGKEVLKTTEFPESFHWKKNDFDATVKHEFTITVTSWDGYNKTETKKVDPCVKGTPPTTTTKPATTTTTPATTAPEVPSSSAEVPPSTTPAAPGGSAPEPPLAATGASPTWLLLSGLGLVGAGAGTLLFLRRRRSA
ncbi:LPXTG cell wall anchor domain-containing protein [Lentzea sp. NPDC058450]|uniref:LPXTG cell wall anchor domain-containing protein n=1 Tax=Lentzea sp. NPDC058450 TaxID=3346505 RepID=UPI0036468406